MSAAGTSQIALAASGVGRKGVDEQLVGGRRLDMRAFDFERVGAAQGGRFRNLGLLRRLAAHLDGGIRRLHLVRKRRNRDRGTCGFVPYGIGVSDANELLRREVHEKCSVRMRPHVVLVAFARFNEMVHHAQHERRIGSRPNGHPLIRFGRGAREAGIDHDELATGLLGIEYEMHFLHVRLGIVAAEHDDGLGSDEVLPRTCILLHAQRGQKAHVATVVPHDAEVRERGAVVRHSQKRIDDLREYAVIAGHAEKRVSRRAVRVHVALHVLMDEVDGLLPADALELPCSALADALHGVFHAVRRIDALKGVRDAAQAYAMVCVVRKISRLHLHDCIVFHESVDTAASHAVRRAHGTHDPVVFGLTAPRLPDPG